MFTYLPEGDFDQCPGLVSIHKEQDSRNPYRFFNTWVQDHNFKEIVMRTW